MSDRKDNDRSGALYCSFCGKTEDQVEQLITGPGVCICNECVMLCDAMLNETPMLRHSNPKGDRSEEMHLLTPQQIKEKLDEYVIGQDDAKKTLAAFDNINYSEILLRPLSLRLFKILRPALVRILFLKPCSRERCLRFGW
jgi:ATP-dependent Clp protease ATP-binding subunit ClpX